MLQPQHIHDAWNACMPADQRVDWSKLSQQARAGYLAMAISLNQTIARELSIHLDNMAAQQQQELEQQSR